MLGWGRKRSSITFDLSALPRLQPAACREAGLFGRLGSNVNFRQITVPQPTRRLSGCLALLATRIAQVWCPEAAIDRFCCSCDLFLCCSLLSVHRRSKAPQTLEVIVSVVTASRDERLDEHLREL